MQAGGQQKVSSDDVWLQQGSVLRKTSSAVHDLVVCKWIFCQAILLPIKPKASCSCCPSSTDSAQNPL
jgi:hypothetical protein